MKTIELTQGQTALIDDEDFESVSKHHWHYDNGYALTNMLQENGKRSTVRLHQFIMKPAKGIQVDHRNGLGTDCQRHNLRIATPLENSRNKAALGATGLKGVHFNGKWIRSRIKVEGKTIHLGYFKNIIDAAKAYDKAAKEYFGEFARLNFEQ